MAILTQKEIYDKLIKNELNYNSYSNPDDKRTFYNWGYIGIGYLLKHYDVISPEMQHLINSSKLYSKIYSSYINKDRSNDCNKQKAIVVLSSKLDNIVLQVNEIKALLNTLKVH